MSKQTLPIDSFLPEFVRASQQHSSVILMAEPGAGKTTRAPVALIENNQSKWIVLQPRRWAAKLTATRIAEENGWRLGEEVGYQIRFENRVSKNSRIILMTEGVLLRKLASDPELTGFTGVILDEFHERSLDLDLTLALLKEIQESLRPELKIIVMSATLDPAPLERFLPGSKSFSLSGRTFPVVKRYLPQSGRELDLIPSLRLALESEGDILIFLPGSFEIERACDQIFQYLRETGEKAFEVMPLYASLPEDKQKRVFEAGVKRKIICSTNIAETSLTLPNVKVVIDSGLTKVMRMDPQLGLDRLETLRISRASSEQRAGRAGRVSAGICIRLWSEAEQMSLRHFETPEIHRVSLSRALLLLSEFGVSNFDDFAWFEKPKSSMLDYARAELARLGFLVKSAITPLGKRALGLPLEPKIAAIVLSAEKNGHPEFGARFAAYLENISPRESIRDEEKFFQRLNRLMPVEARAAEQIYGKRDVPTIHFQNGDAYLDTLIESCREKITIQGKMVGRRRVKAKDGPLPDFCLVLSAIERTEIIANSWVPLTKANLLKFAQKKRQVYWDEELKRVKGVEGLFFEDLELGNLTDVPATREEASQALVPVILSDAETILSRNEGFLAWLKRVHFFNRHRSEGENQLEIPWRDLIETSVDGKTRLEEVISSPLVQLVEGLLPSQLLHELESWAPAKIEVPTGNLLPVDYESDPPRLAVRLQEVFGWLDTPKLAKGRVPLVMELLSPGFKPIQVTKDLRSFWENTYFEVKKELKARYPKHSWPEDPLTAQPVAKGRRRPS